MNKEEVNEILKKWNDADEHNRTDKTTVARLKYKARTVGYIKFVKGEAKIVKDRMEDGGPWGNWKDRKVTNDDLDAYVSDAIVDLENIKIEEQHKVEIRKVVDEEMKAKKAKYDEERKKVKDKVMEKYKNKPTKPDDLDDAFTEQEKANEAKQVIAENE